MPSIAHLADVLYREEVARARAMSPEDKVLEGPRLFDRACRVMRDGIRHQHPDLDDAGVLPDGLQLEPQAAFEAVTGTTRYLVTLQQSPFVCELFVCGDDPHDTARFERRERVRVLNRDAFMATAEDMIITKLRWATLAKRAKDRDDVRNIIAVRGAELDWNYIERWCAIDGTITLLGEIRDSIPPAWTAPL